jgi:hypothetical protein
MTSPTVWRFQTEMQLIPRPRILELGTKQSIPGRSTMHKDWVPHAGEFVGTDFDQGLDVDFVADLHFLSAACGRELFDGVISCSTLEHVKYPWLAAREIAAVLKLGGVLFIQTHQTFPLHAYPYDYWRYTTDALRAIFNPLIGLETLVDQYEFPARIWSGEDSNTANHPAFLNSCLVAKKVRPTPPAWQPEWSSSR